MCSLNMTTSMGPGTSTHSTLATLFDSSEKPAILFILSLADLSYLSTELLSTSAVLHSKFLHSFALSSYQNLLVQPVLLTLNFISTPCRCTCTGWIFRMVIIYLLTHFTVPVLAIFSFSLTTFSTFPFFLWLLSSLCWAFSAWVPKCQTE